ncbi:DUF1294 domain-containing protein [Clostridium sp. D33t1_170424_F3]|uniref:DUF1294 domain-containing protein n=1 Tax=Clostridium sp. D33t1_170424_F3 TaxID=2787099 RepID=UPI0018AB79F5|nr:DUF1294 domain-containing protein [Clostridium sp. D33t1_170424_F3]
MPYWILYFVFISLVAIILTVHDKNAAQKHRWRVPEATLLWVAALGGSVAMYLTMQIIRHKTKHQKFMIGIPIIFFIQLIAIAFIVGRAIFPNLFN